MANAITAIFGADASQMRREMETLETVAGLSGRRMGAAFSGGFGKHGGPGGGISGIMRETLVIFRELGRGNFTRIPGSATLLFQYLGGLGYLLKSTAAEAVKAADADAKLAQKMALAAVIAREKADASKAAVIAGNLDAGASLRQALADNVAAVAAKKNAEAQMLKADASGRAAEMQLAEATTSLGPLGIAVLAVAAALVALWGIYKIVNVFRKQSIESEKAAAETALKLKLSYQEQAEALKKLSDAAQKTKDALAKLHEEQNKSVHKAQDAIEAIKNQAQAESELNDAKKRSAELQVDLDEKSGKISHEEAITQRADIEKKAVADKAAAKSKELYDIMYSAGGADVNAQKKLAADEAAAQAASDSPNVSPEGIKNAKRLALLEKIEKQNRQEADELMKKGAGETGADKKNDEAFASAKAAVADFAQHQADALRDKMHPGELAAAEAMRKAEESKAAVDQLHEVHQKAVQDYVQNQKNTPAQVAAEQANIDKQKQLDLMGVSQHGGFGLNSQQRVGAYAATPPDWKVLLMDVKGIRENTGHMKPSPNAPPRPQSTQYGPVSHR